MLTRLLHKLVTLISVAIFLLISSCAYRFTNLHMRAPNKAKTIAVEGIYDTSRLALPHEYLWESLQKYIAINGRLKLAPKNQADLYLRCQLVSAEIRPFDVRHQAAQCRLRLIEQAHKSGHDFVEVMRRNIGGHTHSNTHRTSSR